MNSKISLLCNAAGANSRLRVFSYPNDCRAQFFFDILECVLFFGYAMELLIRVLAFGLKGFTKPWILFDSFLVTIGSVFYIVSYNTEVALDPGASSSLRIIRIARVCRLFLRIDRITSYRRCPHIPNERVS